MMYKEDFVCVIKTNEGKVLREHKNIVHLPFGSEYSICLKNLRNERALVSVEIDGTDVLNNSKLIVNGNSTITLERFLEDLDKGNRFKFIEKTEKISEYRGDKIEDGIIRIEFQFEKSYIPKYEITTYPKGILRGRGIGVNELNELYGSNGTFYNSISPSCISTTNVSLDNLDNNLLDNVNESGITVKGSISNQKFSEGYIGELLPEKYVITLQLKGINEDQKIEKPLVVSNKIKCETCGTNNNGKNKFCAECGTSLI